MEYTVERLLQNKELSQLKISYGSAGADRQVKGIRIIEIEDMERYLTGGEILVTSFYVYRFCSNREVEQHFEDLVQKNISGFIVKRVEEHDPGEVKFSILKKHCIKYNIPLIEIPKELYYWGIIRTVMSLVFDKEIARLKYFKITHDNFNTLSLNSRDSQISSKDIISFLGTMIENPIALYYNNGECFASTEENAPKLNFSDQLEYYKPEIVTKFKYMRQNIDEKMQYIVKVDILNEVETYIAITEKNRQLTDLDYMAIENAIITLQYCFVSEFAQNEVRKKYQRDIMHNILYGVLNDAEMKEAAGTTGLAEDKYYRVVDFHTIPKNIEGKYTEEQLHEVGVIEGELVHLLPEEYIYRNMDQIVMIKKVDKDEDEFAFQRRMEEIYDIIQCSIVHRKKTTDFQIGIGKRVLGYLHLNESYKQARKAIEYIDIARIVTGNPAKSVVQYSNLGFYQIFGEIEDKNELLNYIPETLKKLFRYDKEHKGELVPTLQAYVNNNQSVKKTSQELFIHYRTVAYRIDKIVEITGINFENPNEMLAVSNGLIIYKMING